MMLRRMTLGLLFITLIVFPLWADPQITGSTIRGLVIGEATRLTLQGKQLGPNPEIHLDFPAVRVHVLPESNTNQLELEIELASDAVPGHGSLRVSTDDGISEALTLGIDHLPEAPFTEQIETLPIALSGSLTGSTLLSTQFSGKQGQRVVVDVEAQRIGSKLLPLIRIVDQRDTQLAYSSREITAGGDARVDLILPADGTYQIKLQDASFQGAAPGHFRLKVGTFGYADVPFPLALHTPNQGMLFEAVAAFAETGSATPPHDEALNLELPPLSAEPQPVAFLPLNVSGSFSGPRPVVLLSDIPEHIEATPRAEDAAQTLGAAPLAVSGRIQKAAERDRYLVEVTPGKKYRAEVFAQRMRSPLDAVVEVRKPDGGVLASADDQPQTPDPAAVFDVPAGVTQVEVSVHDLSQSASDTYFYRLQIAPANYADFTLRLPSARFNIPAGGSAVLEVIAERRGYRGPIELQFPELPGGVEVSLNTIPANVDRALVSFTDAQDAQGVGIGSVIGKAVAGDRALLRTAAVGGEAISLGEAPRSPQLALGVARQPSLSLAWNGAIPADALQLGRTSTFPVKVTRGETQKGPVRFSLVTSQIVPQKQGKPDLEKALQLAGETILPTDQSEATVTVTVPRELADTAWDLAVKGELLSEDQKTVLATATTSAQRLTLGSPLFLALTGESVVRLKGTISRAGGFNAPVTIVATGLPEGAKAPEVQLPGDQTEFTLEITLPANLKPEQLQNVQLLARAQKDGQPLTSNEVGIKLETGAK